MEEQEPLVSVLMTAYNRELYIADAIESVLASTYTNFELIIVDDCSKDKTVAIAKGYAEQDTRIRFYQNEQNLGDYNNRNKAASYAKGKYLKYWDSDDIMYPHCLDVVVRCMEQHPAAGWGLIKPHIEPYAYEPYPICIDKPFEEFINQQGLFSNSPGSSVIRRDVFNQFDGFSGKRYIGDYEFWLKIGQASPLVILPSFLGWTRTHGDQEKSFDPVSYEKLRIDSLTSAVNTTILNNKDELKARLKKTQINARLKIIFKSLLFLRFAKAKKDMTLLFYFLKKIK